MERRHINVLSGQWGIAVIDSIWERGSDYEAVLDFPGNRDDWKTTRLHPPKRIPENFQGVETGIRQLRRTIPLDTERIDRHGRQLTVPTIPEMIRIKGWMIVGRNAARDYIDFAALVEHAGLGFCEKEKFRHLYGEAVVRKPRAVTP